MGRLLPMLFLFAALSSCSSIIEDFNQIPGDGPPSSTSQDAAVQETATTSSNHTAHDTQSEPDGGIQDASL